MPTRRQFVESATVWLLMVPLARCSSSFSCNGVASTSTNNAGHTHMLCVPTTDLTSPPSAGASYTTTSDSGHTHGVTLTQLQLQQIQAKMTVTVTTTSNSGHTHDFAISQM